MWPFHKYSGTAFPYRFFILNWAHLLQFKVIWGSEKLSQKKKHEEGRGVPYNPAAACKSPCNNVSSRIFLHLYRGSSFLILRVPAMWLCFIYLWCSHPGLCFPSAASWKALLTVSTALHFFLCPEAEFLSHLSYSLYTTWTYSCTYVLVYDWGRGASCLGFVQFLFCFLRVLFIFETWS